MFVRLEVTLKHENCELEAAKSINKSCFDSSRVYSSGVSSPSRQRWFDEMEQLALTSPRQVVALSESDRVKLAELQGAKKESVEVLLPPFLGR